MKSKNSKKNKDRENKGVENGGSEIQPILFTREQYKELIRAFSAYTLIKQSSILPNSESSKLFSYIVEQGEKFGFEKAKMDEMEWFEEVNDEIYESLFQYTQEEMWQHMAGLFARRDAKEEIMEETGLSEKELPPDMFLDSMAKRISLYLKEFEKNGINNMSCSNVKKKLLGIKKC